MSATATAAPFTAHTASTGVTRIHRTTCRTIRALDGSRRTNLDGPLTAEEAATLHRDGIPTTAGWPLATCCRPNVPTAPEPAAEPAAAPAPVPAPPAATVPTTWGPSSCRYCARYGRPCGRHEDTAAPVGKTAPAPSAEVPAAELDPADVIRVDGAWRTVVAVTLLPCDGSTSVHAEHVARALHFERGETVERRGTRQADPAPGMTGPVDRTTEEVPAADVEPGDHACLNGAWQRVVRVVVQAGGGIDLRGTRTVRPDYRRADALVARRIRRDAADALDMIQTAQARAVAARVHTGSRAAVFLAAAEDAYRIGRHSDAYYDARNAFEVPITDEERQGPDAR